MSRGFFTPPFMFPAPLVMGRSQGEARARQRSHQGREKLSKAQSQADTSTPTFFKLFHHSLHLACTHTHLANWEYQSKLISPDLVII